MAYHALQEEIVDILVNKTQSQNKHFFRLLVAYHFAQMASMMRCMINSKDRGVIPVNLYVLNLAVSGFGKNHSLNIVEDQLMSGFKRSFTEDVFPSISDIQLEKIAEDRALRDNVEIGEAIKKVQSEFDGLGIMAFSFDSGTVPAIKQMRQKLLMANAGSINFICDEIGSNLIGNTDVLTAYLELFDIGAIKQKLIKNTKENTRVEEIDGKTPTNALLFGTPDKLLDGGKTEEEFNVFLLSGYARRLLCGYTPTDKKPANQTASELFDALTNKVITGDVSRIKKYMTGLASMHNFNSQLEVSKEVTIELLQYKIDCEKKASSFGSHEEIHKAEIIHRYFKVLKLSGAYAFMDKSTEITSENLQSAISLVEDAGYHFSKIMQREGSYVRLAHYLADTNKEVTHVDLIENLPFFRGTEVHKKTMISLAMAYGYKNNICIKKSYVDDIEFLKGEALEETDIDKIIITFSKDITTGFTNEIGKFSELHKLAMMPDYHFTSHHLKDGYRDADHIINGFNLCVIDVDGGVQLEVAKSLLKDYSYLMYTTKRHTINLNRFRVIIPLSHTLKLNERDYRKFMENIYSWLPFDCDIQTNQRSRKWMTHNGAYHENNGKLLDVTTFIPKTDKAERRQKAIAENQNMSNLQRWFALQAIPGNRSNVLLKYGFCLLDAGNTRDIVRAMVLEFNGKLENPLDITEVDTTIMVTIDKRAAQK